VVAFAQRPAACRSAASRNFGVKETVQRHFGKPVLAVILFKLSGIVKLNLIKMQKQVKRFEE